MFSKVSYQNAPTLFGLDIRSELAPSVEKDPLAPFNYYLFNEIPVYYPSSDLFNFFNLLTTSTPTALNALKNKLSEERRPNENIYNLLNISPVQSQIDDALEAIRHENVSSFIHSLSPKEIPISFFEVIRQSCHEQKEKRICDKMEEMLSVRFSRNFSYAEAYEIIAPLTEQKEFPLSTKLLNLLCKYPLAYHLFFKNKTLLDHIISSPKSMKWYTDSCPLQPVEFFHQENTEENPFQVSKRLVSTVKYTIQPSEIVSYYTRPIPRHNNAPSASRESKNSIERNQLPLHNYRGEEENQLLHHPALKSNQVLTNSNLRGPKSKKTVQTAHPKTQKQSTGNMDFHTAIASPEKYDNYNPGNNFTGKKIMNIVPFAPDAIEKFLSRTYNQRLLNSYNALRNLVSIEALIAKQDFIMRIASIKHTFAPEDHVWRGYVKNDPSILFNPKYVSDESFENMFLFSELLFLDLLGKDLSSVLESPRLKILLEKSSPALIQSLLLQTNLVPLILINVESGFNIISLFSLLSPLENARRAKLRAYQEAFQLTNKNASNEYPQTHNQSNYSSGTHFGKLVNNDEVLIDKMVGRNIRPYFSLVYIAVMNLIQGVDNRGVYSRDDFYAGIHGSKCLLSLLEKTSIDRTVLKGLKKLLEEKIELQHYEFNVLTELSICVIANDA